MQLLDHVSIGVPNLDSARRFYDAIMSTLGAAKVYDRPDALGYGERCAPDDTASTYLAVYVVLLVRADQPQSEQLGDRVDDHADHRADDGAIEPDELKVPSDLQL